LIYIERREDSGSLYVYMWVVEKHRRGKTALDRADRRGMTECAAVLRGMAPRARSDSDMDSDDNSDTDERYARDNRDLTLGEQVIRNERTR